MEFTATLPLKIEVTIKAKNRQEALSFLDDLYANITLEWGKREIEIIDDNLSLIEFNWELED
jgi:hypothetical protein